MTNGHPSHTLVGVFKSNERIEDGTATVKEYQCLAIRNSTDARERIEVILPTDKSKGMFKDEATAISACTGSFPWLAETAAPTSSLDATGMSCGPKHTFQPIVNGSLPEAYNGIYSVTGQDIAQNRACIASGELVFRGRTESMSLPTAFGLTSGTVSPNVTVAAMQVPADAAATTAFACYAFQLHNNGSMMLYRLSMKKNTLEEAASECNISMNLYGLTDMVLEATFIKIPTAGAISCTNSHAPFYWSDGVGSAPQAVLTNVDGRSQQEIDRAVCLAPGGRAVLERHSTALQTIGVVASGTADSLPGAIILLTQVSG